MASFKVAVNGASAQIDALIKKLAGSSLTKPLYATKAYLQTPDLESACAELAEFESEVRAAENARELTSTQASSLLASAVQIETVVDCKP